MKSKNINIISAVAASMLALTSISACNTQTKKSTTPQNSIAKKQYLKAFGFSPAWQAEIHGNNLSYEVPETGTPDGKSRTISIGVIEGSNDITRYNGSDNGLKVILNIRKGTCTKATIGGKELEFHATLNYGDKTYKGCATKAVK